MNLMPGTLLQSGKYRIERFIGSGGFGCTYQALHVMLNTRVAIKEFFVSDFCDRDDTAGTISVGSKSKVELINRLREKFIREAQMLFGLNHPGLVRVTDIFEENGTAYYVMDFIDGVSLRDIVRQRGPLPEAEALAYIRQVASALEYVHSHNLLHLDIKPGNIMVERSGTVKLIDFGASKHYDAGTGENTTTILGLNTPGYAPVEQCTGMLATFTPATDIYALGATLYFLLTGKTPPASVSLVSGNAVLEPLPRGISDSTARAVSAAMSHRIEERPVSVWQFMRMLGDTGTLSGDNDDTEAFVRQEKPKKKPTSTMAIMAGALIALAVIIGGIAFYFSNKGENSDYVPDISDNDVTEETVASDTGEASDVTFEKVAVGEGWMNVPSFFRYEGETDGIMHYSDGKSILFISYYPYTSMTLSAVYDNVVNKHRGSITTYDTYDRSSSKGWFVRSGKKEGHCYYTRVVMKGKSMYSASLSFPESELPLYEKIMGDFFNGFPHVN